MICVGLKRSPLQGQRMNRAQRAEEAAVLRVLIDESERLKQQSLWLDAIEREALGFSDC